MECKGLVRDRFFGKFDNKIYLHRYSDERKFQECSKKAGNDLETALNCLTEYHSQIKETNEKVTHWFKEAYPSYV